MIPETYILQHFCRTSVEVYFNPLNAELNPTYHLLALLGAHPILHISRIKVNITLIQKLEKPPGVFRQTFRGSIAPPKKRILF